MHGLGARAHFNHPTRSYSVAQPGHAFDRGAMLAAEKCAFLFEPVADDMNTAISASRSECMDRALKAIEGVSRAVHAHLKRPDKSGAIFHLRDEFVAVAPAPHPSG
jgi:methionyl-tRNA formyltransferase